MDNSIAHNLKKYNKYLELQKKHGGYNNIYQYKINQYKQLLQQGGVKQQVLDNTASPIQRISEVVTKIDNIMSSINSKPMVGGTLKDILDQIDKLQTKTEAATKDLPPLLPEIEKITAKRQAIMDKIAALKTACATGSITSSEEIERNMTVLQQDIDRLNLEIVATTATHASTVGKLEEQIGALQKQIADAQQVIEATTKLIDDLDTSISS